MKPTRYAGHFLAVFVLCMMHHALPASAGSILVGGDGEDAELAKQWGAGQNRADPHSGSAALELAPGSSVLCPEFVEVDPAKSYTIRGFFKTAQPHGKNRLLISIYFYDNAKQRMMPWCVWPFRALKPDWRPTSNGPRSRRKRFPVSGRCVRRISTRWPSMRRSTCPICLTPRAAFWTDLWIVTMRPGR